VPPAQTIPFQPPRRTWLRAKLRQAITSTGALGMTLLTGGYARFIAPRRIQYPEYDLPIPNLPEPFAGFRILHLSDLHAANHTPIPYLRDVIRHVNSLPKDLTVITGDFVTRELRRVKPAVEVVAQLHGPVIATFGNHDYNESHQPWVSSEIADALEKQLTEKGITVLRNRAIPIERGGARLWIVGLEDYWSDRFNAEQAYKAVTNGDPSIALSHNPDTAHFLAQYHPAWVLSGHTHGGQLRIPIAGSMVLPVQDKSLDQGFHTVGQTRLFISRGVGSHIPVRFRCPPEAPFFTLRPA
jgi:predicted MPP superfamily phosphohydrolase